MVDENVTITIKVNGRPAETVALAAQRHGMDHGAMLSAIRRAGLDPVAPLDARTPLYDTRAVDRLIAERPGHGGRPPGRATA